MPLRLLAFVVGVLAAVAPATSQEAADGGTTARFAISVAGIPAGELVLSRSLAGERYQAGGALRATGLVGAVARLAFEGEVTGRVEADGRLSPERYTAFSRSTRSERDTEIVFENGDPVAVSVVPPRASTPDIADQKGAVDPVSAAVSLLGDGRPEALCNDRVKFFDGSRRSELVVGRADPEGGTVVCNGRLTRLEGEAHTVGNGSEWPFRLVYVANGDGRMVLQRIETPTRFGRAVMERRG